MRCDILSAMAMRTSLLRCLNFVRRSPTLPSHDHEATGQIARIEERPNLQVSASRRLKNMRHLLNALRAARPPRDQRYGQGQG